MARLDHPDQAVDTEKPSGTKVNMKAWEAMRDEYPGDDEYEVDGQADDEDYEGQDETK
jgi:hypothetical protein